MNTGYFDEFVLPDGMKSQRIVDATGESTLLIGFSALQLSGAPFAVATRTTITVQLVKDETIRNPRVERGDYLYTLGSAEQLEEAGKIALNEMIRVLSENRGDRAD